MSGKLGCLTQIIVELTPSGLALEDRVEFLKRIGLWIIFKQLIVMDVETSSYWRMSAIHPQVVLKLTTHNPNLVGVPFTSMILGFDSNSFIINYSNHFFPISIVSFKCISSPRTTLKSSGFVFTNLWFFCVFSQLTSI